MKHLAMILVLIVALSPACIAEKSSTDEFLTNLSKTWDSFLDMADDAGDSVFAWANDAGIVEWAESTAGDISEWAKEVGLTDWADETLGNFNAWFESSGISEWTEEASKNLQSFVEENRPAVEAWLSAAGEEVTHAWNTLMNANQHTQEEVEAAYKVVTESLEDISSES